MCVRVAVCLSVRPSVCLSVCLFFCLFVCLFVCLSVFVVDLCLFVFVGLCVCFAVCLSVCLSACLVVCLFACLCLLPFFSRGRTPVGFQRPTQGKLEGKDPTFIFFERYPKGAQSTQVINKNSISSPHNGKVVLRSLSTPINRESKECPKFMTRACVFQAGLRLHLLGSILLGFSCLYISVSERIRSTIDFSLNSASSPGFPSVPIRVPCLGFQQGCRKKLLMPWA